MSPEAVALLRDAVDTNQAYAQWSGWAVFGGLVAEYLLLFVAAKKSWKERTLAIVFGIMVAGGVGGEVYFGERSVDAAQKLQGAAETKAARAEKKLERLRLRTARLNRDAASSRAMAAQLAERASSLELAIADARRKQADAETRLAEVSTELGRLQLQMGPWRFTGRAADEFQAALASAPKCKVRILYAKDDVKAYWFARQLSHILNVIGWTASEPEPLKPSREARFAKVPAVIAAGAVLDAVTIFARDPSIHPGMNPPTPFMYFQSALGSAVGAQARLDASLADDEFRVVVPPRM